MTSTRNLIYIFVLSALVGCSGSSKKSDAAAPSTDPATPSWSGRMQELNSTLSDLVPFLFDEKQFNDPSNFDTIKKRTKALAELAHDIAPQKDGGVKAPTNDPAIGFFAAQFKDDLNRASESLENDHRVYARSVLRTSISYCVSCHTRSDAGPKFDFARNQGFIQGLAPMERARYYTATRQYESGLKEFLGVLENPETGRKRPFDIERAARSALAISIRVMNNPEQSLRIAKDVIEKPATPLFVRNDANSWVNAIEKWKKEGPRTYAKEAALKRKISELVRQAEALQRYPADLRGDVYYLRATALVHEYFNKFPNSTESQAEIFFLAGKSYEALKDLGFWTLHELYYEQCVRTAPHTQLARQCYERFEQSLLLGYSGSAGLFLPAGVVKQLDELKGLATLK